MFGVSEEAAAMPLLVVHEQYDDPQPGLVIGRGFVKITGHRSMAGVIFEYLAVDKFGAEKYHDASQVYVCANLVAFPQKRRSSPTTPCDTEAS
jgi:hypothetical protein